MPDLSAILVTCQITDRTSVTSFPLGAVIQPKGICLPFAGQALQVSAEAFTSDPCSLPRRQAVVPAARSLLVAVCQTQFSWLPVGRKCQKKRGNINLWC